MTTLVGHFVYCALCRMVTNLAEATQRPDGWFVCHWCRDGRKRSEDGAR